MLKAKQTQLSTFFSSTPSPDSRAEKRSRRGEDQEEDLTGVRPAEQEEERAERLQEAVNDDDEEFLSLPDEEEEGAEERAKMERVTESQAKREIRGERHKEEVVEKKKRRRKADGGESAGGGEGELPVKPKRRRAKKGSALGDEEEDAAFIKSDPSTSPFGAYSTQANYNATVLNALKTEYLDICQLLTGPTALLSPHPQSSQAFLVVFAGSCSSWCAVVCCCV